MGQCYAFEKQIEGFLEVFVGIAHEQDWFMLRNEANIYHNHRTGTWGKKPYSIQSVKIEKGVDDKLNF